MLLVPSCPLPIPQHGDYIPRDDPHADTDTLTLLAQPLPHPRNHTHSGTTEVFNQEMTAVAPAMPSLIPCLTPSEKRPPTPTVCSGLAEIEQDGLSWTVSNNSPSMGSTSSVPFPSLSPHPPVRRAASPLPAPLLVAPIPTTVDISHSQSVPSLGPSPSSVPFPPSNCPPYSPPYSPITLQNGSPLKPSIKCRSRSIPDLPSLPSHSRALSAPATSHYTPKNVHFAGKTEGLEHIVLFLQEQRPLAVLNGSPEEMEVEADGSSGGYTFLQMGAHCDTTLPFAPPTERNRVLLDPALTSPVPNPSLLVLPALHEPRPIRLESLLISQQQPLTLHGTILVRNLAFRKSVVVRFTLDDWQTVSEVAATHCSHLALLPLPFGRLEVKAAWDRFSFQVRLEDFEPKIEEKTLFLVARYGAAGQEWWDNNSGANYRVHFARAPSFATHTLSQAPSGEAVAIPFKLASPLPRAPAMFRILTPPIPFSSSPNTSHKRSASFGLLNYASPDTLASPPRTKTPLAAEALSKDLADDGKQGMGSRMLARTAATVKVEKRPLGSVGAGAEFVAEQARAEVPKHEVKTVVLTVASSGSSASLSNSDRTPPASSYSSSSASRFSSLLLPNTSTFPGTSTTTPSPPARLLPAAYAPDASAASFKAGKIFTVAPLSPPCSVTSPMSFPSMSDPNVIRSEQKYEEFLQKYCFYSGPNEPKTRSGGTGMRRLSG